jgi:hypothetical protein
MSEDQIFNLLSIDVIKLIVDLYYIPIIKTFIIEDENSNKKFYMGLTYPSYTIKINIPKPNVSQCRGRICYETKNFDAFWFKLKANEVYILEGENELNEDEIKIKLTSKNIRIINENTTIDLPNTDLIRDQILDVIYYYIEYLDNENAWI